MLKADKLVMACLTIVAIQLAIVTHVFMDLIII